MKPNHDICRACHDEACGDRGGDLFGENWEMHGRVWCKCCYSENATLSGRFDGGYFSIVEDVPLGCAYIAEMAVSQ